MKALLTSLSVLGLLVACGESPQSSSSNSNALAGCDRSSIEQWLLDSGVRGWSVGEGANGLEVGLPNSDAERAAAMKAELEAECGEAVGVDVGPPADTAG